MNFPGTDTSAIYLTFIFPLTLFIDLFYCLFEMPKPAALTWQCCLSSNFPLHNITHSWLCLTSLCTSCSFWVLRCILTNKIFLQNICVEERHLNDSTQYSPVVNFVKKKWWVLLSYNFVALFFLIGGLSPFTSHLYSIRNRLGEDKHGETHLFIV